MIAESGVTKVTFYRHFPSKNDLILAYLAYRHERWMDWFTDALQRHGAARGKGIDALVPALAEWFSDAGYRGCAFINSVGELGGALPEVVEIARNHKRDMAAPSPNCCRPRDIAPRTRRRSRWRWTARSCSAQFEEDRRAALKPLERLVKLLPAGV